MANQGTCISKRMQGIPPKEDYLPFPPSPNNPRNEGAIEEAIGSNMDSLDPSNHQEWVVETIKEGFLSPTSPP